MLFQLTMTLDILDYYQINPSMEKYHFLPMELMIFLVAVVDKIPRDRTKSAK